jgi:hypothetical protein
MRVLVGPRAIPRGWCAAAARVQAGEARGCAASRTAAVQPTAYPFILQVSRECDGRSLCPLRPFHSVSPRTSVQPLLSSLRQADASTVANPIWDCLGQRSSRHPVATILQPNNTTAGFDECKAPRRHARDSGRPNGAPPAVPRQPVRIPMPRILSCASPSPPHRRWQRSARRRAAADQPH